MKRLILAIGLICASVYVAAQAVTPLTNKVTSAHQSPNGTHVALIPPPGFVPATQFTGYQQPASSASIQISELGGAVTANMQKFSSESLMTRGMFVQQQERLQVGINPGQFIVVEQFAGGTKVVKYIMLLGDTQRTFLIMSTFPKDVAAIGPMIKDAMFSVAIP